MAPCLVKERASKSDVPPISVRAERGRPRKYANKAEGQEVKNAARRAERRRKESKEMKTRRTSNDDATLISVARGRPMLSHSKRVSGLKCPEEFFFQRVCTNTKI